MFPTVLEWMWHCLCVLVINVSHFFFVSTDGVLVAFDLVLMEGDLLVQVSLQVGKLLLLLKTKDKKKIN